MALKIGTIFQDLTWPLGAERMQRTMRFIRRKFLVFSGRFFAKVRESDLALIGIAAGVGFVVGCGVSVLQETVAWLHFILFNIPLTGHLSAGLEPLTIVGLAAPTVGGLLIGVIASSSRLFRSREIVDPIEANALYGGRMSLGDSINLAIQTVIAVGFGGSAGLEAAYTQLGSGFASKMGRYIRLRRQDLRLLVGCGSAAAISAAFNSPLTGAFYAFELVIGSYTLQALAPIASAALCGNLTFRALSGSTAIFVVPSELLLKRQDYLLFILLGFAAGLLAIAAMWTVTYVEQGFRRQKVPGFLRPAIGGAGVGLIASYVPEVLGSGHGAVSLHLDGNSGLEALIVILIAKTAASALTVGSGMRGGLFSSSLFLGAIFGSASALFIKLVAPGFPVDTAAYSLVGMAAVAAGIVGAPVSMILLVLETTGNFSLTIGVMAGVIASTVLVQHGFGYSFATWRFHVRGLRIKSAHDVGWIRELTVGKLMRRDFNVVSASETVSKLRERFPLGGPKVAFVLDEHSAYLGTIDTIEAHLSSYDAGADVTQAKALIHNEPVTVTPEENIQAALSLFHKTASEVVAVVESHKTGRLVGYVTEAYVLRRYSQELEKQRLGETDGGVFSPEIKGT